MRIEKTFQHRERKRREGRIMSDLGVFSDTDDSVAVDELISQAEDLCVLEQISKINTAASSCSLLPTHLETRFRNLKSLHLPNPQTQTQTQTQTRTTAVAAAKIHGQTDQISFSDSDPDPDPHGKLGVEKEPPPTESASSPSDSWNSSIISPGEGGSPDRKRRGLKKKHQLHGSPPSDSGPNFNQKPEKSQGSGCFWCLPKRVSKKLERKESLRFDWVSKDDEFLAAGLGSSFSVKEQQKILRRAMKEEEKISREAEKIVIWAKQASARMSLHGIELDELNDDPTSPK